MKKKNTRQMTQKIFKDLLFLTLMSFSFPLAFARDQKENFSESDIESVFSQNYLDLNFGKKHKIDLKAAQANRGTVFAFVSMNCPCSRNHENVLVRLHQEFSKKGFQFFGVHSNSNEAFEDSKKYFQSRSLPFPILEDQEKEGLAEHLAALKTPHAYILDNLGNILFQGGIDDSRDTARAKKHYLKNALQDLSEGKAVNQKAVRVLGCEIQRKKRL